MKNRTLEHSYVKDAWWQGQLGIWQPARGRGYRFNLDPILLVGFAPISQHVLDLGTGCGVIALLLLATNKAQSATGVECQKELYECALKNAAENNFDKRMHLVHQPLQDYRGGTFDLVVFNPPYFRMGEGKAPPDLGRRIARYESAARLQDFVDVAVRCASADAKICAIVRSERRMELSELFDKHGFAVERSRAVVARSGSQPIHFLVQASRRVTTTQIEQAPLVVHLDEGGYTSEVQAHLSPPKV